MKFLTILLTVFALKSCGTTKAATNMQENIETKHAEIPSGKYLITTLINKEDLPDNIYLNFNESSNSVSGYAGCNTFSTEYRIEGDIIKFGSFMSTRMYCKDFMEVEKNLMHTLGQITSYSIENNVLILKKEEETYVEAVKDTSLKITQGEEFSIEYTATSRGTFSSVTIKDKNIFSQKDRNSKPEERKCTTEEIATIYKYLETIDLEELANLEPPSTAHQFDGAAGATLKITKDGKTYVTKTFDHGKPSKQLVDLINTMLNMAKIQ